MNSYDECKAIVELDLDPIKVKLMHKESGESWSLQQANAAEADYRRFLYLTKTFPAEDISPSPAVDIFWHYHILDTMKYAKDCQEIFGYFLHHFPYVGMRGEDDLGAREEMETRTRALYERAFPASSSAADADGVAAGAAAAGADASRAWCSVTGKQVWCSVTGKHAWCSVAAKQAWCSVAGKKAWCSVTGTKAWCPVTGNQAWCSVTAKQAWCSVTGQQAWCSVTGKSRAPDFFSTRPRLEEDLIAA
jgi:hypothetical protein